MEYQRQSQHLPVLAVLMRCSLRLSVVVTVVVALVVALVVVEVVRLLGPCQRGCPDWRLATTQYLEAVSWSLAHGNANPLAHQWVSAEEGCPST